MPANPRRSSAKLPITNSEKVKTAASRGEENDENNNASAQIMRNCSTMKKSAPRTSAPGGGSWWAKKNNAPKTPMAIRNVFTTSVPAKPKNLPTMNSQRRTGRESTV